MKFKISKKFKIITLSTCGIATLGTGLGLLLAQHKIHAVNKNVNISLTKNEIEKDILDKNSHMVFNAMEDAGMNNGKNTLEIIKDYHLENGLVRLINSSGNRITLPSVLGQIYNLSSVDLTVLDSTWTIDAQKSTSIDTKKYPLINNLFIGTFLIDYVSKGKRTGVSEIWLKNNEVNLLKEIQDFTTNSTNSSKLKKILETTPTYKLDEAIKTHNNNDVSRLLLNATGVTKHSKLIEDTDYYDKSLHYGWFPFSIEQQEIFQIFAHYNIKAMFNSVPIDQSFNKGPSNGDYFKDPVKNELDRMGADWALAHWNEWRDINYGAFTNPIGSGAIRNEFSQSARIALQKPDEKFDITDGGKRTPGQVTPQRYLNDQRIESEMVPYFTQIQYGVMRQFGTKLAPYDVDNEPNIDIAWGSNFGLTPKQYVRLGKGVHDLLKNITKTKTFQLSTTWKTGDPTITSSGISGLTNPKAAVTFSDGIDLTISLDSHSRLNADDTFGLWKGRLTPNNETNEKRYGIKVYVDEVIALWPDIIKNSILTYHTYWDYKPEIIEDVYKWAQKFINKNYDIIDGIVPDPASHTHIDPHTTIITELSYNFWPDAKLDNDGMGGWGGDNESWFMAIGYAYQMHSHSRYSRSQAFMPYHGGERIFSDTLSRAETIANLSPGAAAPWWAAGKGNEKYLKDYIYQKDLDGNIIKNLKDENGEVVSGTTQQVQYFAGVTPSLHVYRMLNAGDIHLNNLSNSIENNNPSIFGDVWVSEAKDKIKLFFVNDSETDKNVNINLDGYTISSSPIEKEFLSIIGGVSNRDILGYKKENGFEGIKYLKLDGQNGRESRISIVNSNVKFNIPAWGMYSVVINVS